MTAENVARIFDSATISTGLIRRSAIHLSKPLRAALYDEESPQHRTATGEFFEALVYEILLCESENSHDIDSVVAKFSDAEYVPYDKYSPDGLWYSRDGGIRFKVNGKVVAEVDFLVRTNDGVRVFGEVILNPASAGCLGNEIAQKRALLKRLYGDELGVQFVLVCSKPVLKPRFLEEGDAVVVIEDGDKLYKQLHENEVLHKKSAPMKSMKRVDGKDW